jgi:starvation-inducible DNA-binding protein
MQFSNTELAKHLSVILSDLVVYKFTSHGYHWNVKGPLFPQFHDFFGELYEDAESAIDPTGESIRKLGFDAPYTLGDFLALSSGDPRVAVGDPIEMSRVLYELNENLVAHLTVAFEVASACNQEGIANFLAGRIETHQKFMWQLGTICGNDATSLSSL